MAAPTPVDPLKSLLTPVNTVPALATTPVSVPVPKTMATPVEPTSRPIADAETPEVATSAVAPTTQAPSPSAVVPTTSAAAPTTSSPAPTTAAPSPSPSTVPEPVEPTTSSTISSSSIVPTSTSTSTSTTPTSTSATPTSTSTSSTTPSSSSTSSSTSTSQAVSTITSTISREQPGLITSFASVSRTSSVSAANASSTGKGGIGGSGLPLGGLVGIIIGGIIALCLAALIVTRQIRKKARSRRTAHRTSMFEPWAAPAPVTLEDEDDLEKARYSPPSQDYPMQNTGQYDYETYDVYGQAGVGAGAAAAAAATYPPSGQQYPNQDYGYQGQQGQGPEYNAQQPYDAATAGTASVAAAAMGLRDGMMVMVSVGFVRSLEDELAVAPGQQLWLHTAYDDGWTLCEDQNQNRGVVPLTCIEPWTEDSNHLSAMPRSNTAESLSATSQRRSSLYQNAQAGNAYLSAPGAGP